LVLVHGLLISSRMFERLAASLPDRRIVLVDLRGHGQSTRPLDSASYSWDLLADDVLTVLDELRVDRAVIGGTSLGADVTLAFGAKSRERRAGLYVAMPVLAESDDFARSLFRPIASVFELAAWALTPLTSALGGIPVPRRPPELALVRDILSVEPKAAAALVSGLLDCDAPDEKDLAGFDAPVLVIGHRADRLHALADAQPVVDAVETSALVQVRSFLYYRFRPRKLAAVVDDFLDDHNL